MFKKILKGILFLIGGLLVLALVFCAVVYFKTESRINKVYTINLQKLNIPNDSISYAAGKHIAENRGCIGCHGANFSGGRPFMKQAEPPLGELYAGNITSGIGGIQYTDEDWVRALRHGLGKDNKSLWLMPSHEFYHLSNQDMGELISFIRVQKPIDNNVPAKSLKPLGRFLTFIDRFPLLPAEKINHELILKDHIEPTVTPQYGAYLATVCRGCHGPELKGAPAHEKLQPAFPDISSTGSPGKWKESEFITAMRTGKLPDGKQLSEFMPWKFFTYTDDELKAVYMYLQQLK